jgi:protein MPE1
MSKRFDGREDPAPAAKATPVCDNIVCSSSHLDHLAQTPVVSGVTNEDEAAAMAAMFQAQTANWEETQEKMSQLVLRLSWRSVLCSRLDLMDIGFPSVFYV